MKDETVEWVKKAESDYGNADLTLEHGEEHIVETVCFHSQQCAEKYLKAMLRELDVKFPHEHDLSALVELCVNLDAEFEAVDGDAHKIAGYAVAIRYPGVFATREEAEKAFAAATRIRAFVRAKLGLIDEKKNDESEEGDKE